MYLSINDDSSVAGIYSRVFRAYSAKVGIVGTCPVHQVVGRKRVSFSDGQARMTQGFAEERQLEDAALQRKTIVGDEDGYWLSRQIEDLYCTRGPIEVGEDRSYRFLSDDEEVVLNQLNEPGSNSVIEMPAGSTIRRIKGDGYQTWVFRIDNGLRGKQREYFDLAYREIAPDAHLLYLKHHRRSRVSSSR